MNWLTSPTTKSNIIITCLSKVECFKKVQRVENNEQRAKNNKQQENDDEIQVLSFMLCHLYKKQEEKINDEIQALSFMLIIIIIIINYYYYYFV